MGEQDRIEIYWRNDVAFWTQIFSAIPMVIAIIIICSTQCNSPSWLAIAFIFGGMAILGFIVSEIIEALDRSFEYTIQLDERSISIDFGGIYPLVLRGEILCNKKKKYLRVKDQYGVELKKLRYNQKTINAFIKYGVKFVKEIPDWY